MREELISIKTPYEFIDLLDNIKSIDDLLLNLIRDMILINLNIIYNPDYDINLLLKHQSIIKDYFYSLLTKSKICGNVEVLVNNINNGCYSIIETLIKYNYKYLLDELFSIKRIDTSTVLISIYKNIVQ